MGFDYRKGKKKFYGKPFREILRDKKKRRAFIQKLFEKAAAKKRGNQPTTIKIGMMPFPVSKKPIGKVFKRAEPVKKYMSNRIISIYNGRFFVNYKTNTASFGHKYGEFSFTKQWKGVFIHRKKKKKGKRGVQVANLKQVQQKTGTKGKGGQQVAKKGGKSAGKAKALARAKARAKVKAKVKAKISKSKGKASKGKKK